MQPVARSVYRSSENDASSSATRKSLFLTSKSEMLTRKSLFLTSKSEMLTRKSLLLTSKSEMLTRKSLFLTSKSEMLTRKSLFLTSKSEMLTSKSLLLTSKSKTLTRKSLLLTSKSEMLTSKSLFLTSKSEMLTRKSLFLIADVRPRKNRAMACSQEGKTRLKPGPKQLVAHPIRRISRALRVGADVVHFVNQSLTRLSKGNKSKCKPYSELRLTRKSTAAAEALRSEKRVGQTPVAVWIVEVCVVGQVVDLGSEVESALLTEPLTIGDPQIRFEEIRTVCAVDAAVVFDVLQRPHRRTTICVGGQRFEQFSAPVRVVIRSQTCERRARHLPHVRAQLDAVRLRNLHAAAEGENVAPVDRHGSPKLVEIQVSPDLQEVLV